MKQITFKNLVWVMAIAALSVCGRNTSVLAQEYVKSDFQVSDSSEYIYQGVELSVSNTGNMVVTWGMSGRGDIWIRTMTPPGYQPGEQRMVKTPGSTMDIRVAHADSGNFMVMYNGYTDGWNVIGQPYDREGNEIGDTLTISRHTMEMINSFWSTLSADSSGVFGAFLPGLDSMIVEKFSGEGNFVGDPVVLKPEGGFFLNQSGIMTRSGHLILIWLNYADGNIHGKRFTQEGVPMGNVFQVSQIEENSSIQEYAMSSDTSGNFVVVWSTSRDSLDNMYAQCYSAEGVPVGPNTMITGGYNHFEGKMSVSMDLDGDYIVAWQDTRNNDTSFIYMQQVDRTGMKVGDNYRATIVNNHVSPGQTGALQVHPIVRLLRDTIYLAWINYNPDIHYRQVVYANIQQWRVPATGVGQEKDIPVSTIIYPNPSDGTFSLTLDHDYTGSLDIKVFDAGGRLIRKETRSWSGRKITMDLSAVPSGIYYLDIRGDSFHSSKTLFIAK